MSIQIITGFGLNAHEPIDNRLKVADQAARLAIDWLWRGLLVFQEADSGDGADQTYQYTGDTTTNLVGDWALFTSQGIQGPAGNDGADGADGDKYQGASTTSITVPTTHPTTVNLDTATGLAWTPGQTILVANTNLIFFTGVVTSYDSGTGALELESDSNTGTGGPFTAWTVNLAGTAGIAGNALIHTASDVNPFGDTEVAAVEAGAWTPQAPYAASILNDTRSNLTIPAPLNGSMNDHSVSYNGTVWFDNGVWRGPQGAKGDKGNTGNTGSQGIQGPQGPQGEPGDSGGGGITDVSFGGMFASSTNALSVSDIGDGNDRWGIQRIPLSGTFSLDSLVHITYSGTFYDGPLNASAGGLWEIEVRKNAGSWIRSASFLFDAFTNQGGSRAIPFTMSILYSADKGDYLEFAIGNNNRTKLSVVYQVAYQFGAGLQLTS